MPTLTSKLESILSLPIPIRMGGFESTTYKLGCAGWEMCFEHDYSRASYRLALRHPIWKIFAITSTVTFEYMAHLQTNPYAWNEHFPGFDVYCIGSGVRFQMVPQVGAMNWLPMSHVPSHHSYEMKDVDIMDVCPFKRLDESKDLIVDPADVAALMEHILKVQSPKQADIRERRRREAMREGIRLDSIRPEEHIHGQIISLVA